MWHAHSWFSRLDWLKELQSGFWRYDSHNHLIRKYTTKTATMLRKTGKNRKSMNKLPIYMNEVETWKVHFCHEIPQNSYLTRHNQQWTRHQGLAMVVDMHIYWDLFKLQRNFLLGTHMIDNVEMISTVDHTEKTHPPWRQLVHTYWLLDHMKISWIQHFCLCGWTQLWSLAWQPCLEILYIKPHFSLEYN